LQQSPRAIGGQQRQIGKTHVAIDLGADAELLTIDIAGVARRRDTTADDEAAWAEWRGGKHCSEAGERRDAARIGTADPL
jgi:hypothetical protein